MPKLDSILYPKSQFSREEAFADFLQASHYHRPFGEVKMFNHWRFTTTDHVDTQQYEYYDVPQKDGTIHIYRRHWHPNMWYNVIARFLSKKLHISS